MIFKSCEEYRDKVAHLVPGARNFRAVTYGELWQEIIQYARALSTFGLSKGDRFALIGETSHEWAVIDWAAQTLGLVPVPIYPTLPADQSLFIARDAQCKLAIGITQDLADKLADLEGVPVVNLEQLLEKEREATIDQEAIRAITSLIAPTDIATFIYTSGTTGEPKGAMLRHEGFLELNENIQKSLPIDHSDTFLSFLPLSHVFERYAGHVLPMSLGATVAYAKSIATLSSDMKAVRPTIMLCVPRFLESVRARVLNSTKSKSKVQQAIFRLALVQGSVRAQGGFAPLAGPLDKLVGKKIREATGGKIRFFASGGAALAPHVSRFYMAFRLPVLQGYGLTESTAASCINHPSDNDPETVGPPIPGVVVKLAEDGEILLRGPSIMAGYYNRTDDTAAAIDAEGWLHTGDIGAWKGDKLMITDRKKDIIVLANGKNVGPLGIENKLKESALIAEAVVYGDGMEHCVALIVPELEQINARLKSRNLDPVEAATAPESEEVQSLIKTEIQLANKGLADFERVKKHCILPKPFSIEDDELTPSLKVKRRVVRDKYSHFIDSMKRQQAE